ncbi:hypothetical protein BS17DRAFT_360212 [Gyrodon lividus]|nr:hypothetical protein BS17DRAFT_360212 [Gyrodon lividus]
MPSYYSKLSNNPIDREDSRQTAQKITYIPQALRSPHTTSNSPQSTPAMPTLTRTTTDVGPFPLCDDAAPPESNRPISTLSMICTTPFDVSTSEVTIAAEFPPPIETVVPSALTLSWTEARDVRLALGSPGERERSRVPPKARRAHLRASCSSSR